MQLYPTAQLAIKAAQLERNAPLEWRAFLQELAVYTDVHRKNLVLSPLPDLPVNQGRAQSLSTLLDVLGNARNTADKIEKAKQ